MDLCHGFFPQVLLLPVTCLRAQPVASSVQHMVNNTASSRHSYTHAHARLASHTPRCSITPAAPSSDRPRAAGARAGSRSRARTTTSCGPAAGAPPLPPRLPPSTSPTTLTGRGGGRRPGAGSARPSSSAPPLKPTRWALAGQRGAGAYVRRATGASAGTGRRSRALRARPRSPCGARLLAAGGPARGRPSTGRGTTAATTTATPVTRGADRPAPSRHAPARARQATTCLKDADAGPGCHACSRTACAGRRTAASAALPSAL